MQFLITFKELHFFRILFLFIFFEPILILLYKFLSKPVLLCFSLVHQAYPNICTQYRQTPHCALTPTLYNRSGHPIQAQLRLSWPGFNCKHESSGECFSICFSALFRAPALVLLMDIEANIVSTKISFFLSSLFYN